MIEYVRDTPLNEMQRISRTTETEQTSKADNQTNMRDAADLDARRGIQRVENCLVCQSRIVRYWDVILKTSEGMN